VFLVKQVFTYFGLLYAQITLLSTDFKIITDMKKFNRLVVYGCSYTTGAETVDEDWYPGAEEIKAKYGIHYFYDLLTKKYKDFNFHIYDTASKKNSWANQLADKLGVPCLNNAISGNSFHKMYWELEKDLNTGIIKDDDLIFVGITSPERLIDFKHYGVSMLHLGYPDRWPESLKKSQKQFLDFFNSEQVKFQFLVLLEAFLSKASTQLKDRLYFVECDPRALYTKYENVDPSMTPHPDWYYTTINPGYEKFKESKYLVSKYGMYYGVVEADLHAGRHVTIQRHTEWADHIYEEFMKLTSK
jgi:hypothetical protein